MSDTLRDADPVELTVTTETLPESPFVVCADADVTDVYDSDVQVTEDDAADESEADRG